MAEAKLRIKLKHDTEANWLKATTFKPLEGELIIYDVDSAHSAPRFKVGDGVKVVGDLLFVDKSFAKLSEDNTFTGNNRFQGTNTFDNLVEIGGTGRPGTPGQGNCKLRVSFGLGATGLPYSDYGPTAILYKSPSSPTPYNLTFPQKSGTFALTSDVPSFNNFTLLTSKPSDWATNYNAYYIKGDFGFSPNIGDSTWAANKFYSAVPAEIDIQTLTQPIKIQASGTAGWGEYGGLNLSAGKAKLYGIDNSFDDNVGYIDISSGKLTSAVYNADFTLSQPTGDGYGFSVKDTSTLFSVGLNKSQSGDYAQQYYCNIGVPLNVTQIHGFTQLTSQPSDWSTKYSSYYVGFDAFNGNSSFFGRSDGLYKPTNDILLNVGTGHKIKITGIYGSLGTSAISNSITLSNSGINLKHEDASATSTLDILPNNINIKSEELKLSVPNDASYIKLGYVGNIDLKGNYPITITSDASKAYGTNMFKLTVSGQQAIGVDTFSTSSNNLIRFEMTPKFNTNKIRGMAGVDLSLPASAGLLAHIPTGTSQNAMLFGSGAWQVPVQINDGNFKDYAGSNDGTITPSSIYAPISKPEFTSNVTTQAYSFCVYKKGDTRPYFKSVTDLLNSYEHETHTRISNANEVSWTINYRLRGNFVSFTIGTTHKDGRVVMRTFNVSDFLNVISTGTWIDVSGASSTFQFRINTLGSLATTFGIKNNSYNNLTGEWFIILHYAF